MDRNGVLAICRSLESKGLVTIEKLEDTTYELTKEGEYYLDHEFPEETMYKLFEKSISVNELIKLIKND